MRGKPAPKGAKIPRRISAPLDSFPYETPLGCFRFRKDQVWARGAPAIPGRGRAGSLSGTAGERSEEVSGARLKAPLGDPAAAAKGEGPCRAGQAGVRRLPRAEAGGPGVDVAPVARVTLGLCRAGDLRVARQDAAVDYVVQACVTISVACPSRSQHGWSLESPYFNAASCVW